MRKIILFLPPYPGPVFGPPLALLALAAPLREAGYEVKIIDAVITPDYLRVLCEEIANALCLGVSLLTGPMISHAARAARLVKRLRPELPIVFGGWHPSLLPEQTLREDFVDVVVRHQGEITFLEVIRRLERGQPLDLVSGCSFKREGKICHNPDRPVAALSSLPAPLFEAADFDAYEKFSGERAAPYITSVGCPYACHYCTDTVFYKRRFNALPAARVANEMTGLVRRHRLTKIALCDSNFLVDALRALEIARGLMASGLRFTWSFQASTDLLCRMSDDDVRLLGESGAEHIGFGTESASEGVLRLMNKFHQRVPDMFETARKCRQAGIRATFNLILGYPGESEADRRVTLQVMSEIGHRYENVTFSPNIFTPYPGIPIWPELRRLGVFEPQSLEAWSSISLGQNALPWLRGRPYRSLKRNVSFFLLTNQISRAARKPGSSARRLILRIVSVLLSWRVRFGFFHLPLDLWLAHATKRLAGRRSLLTGRRLASSLNEAG